MSERTQQRPVGASQPVFNFVFDARLSLLSTSSSPLQTKTRMKWDSRNIKDYVASISELVFTLQEKVYSLLETIDAVNLLISELSSAPFDKESFAAIIKGLQAHVDQLSLSGFSNLSVWVKSINDKMASVLTSRLSDAISDWVSPDSSREQPSSLPPGHRPTTTVAPINVEIVIQNQAVLSSPSIPAIRELYLTNFYAFASTVASLPLLSASRYDVLSSVSSTDGPPATFSAIIPELHKSSPVVLTALVKINEHISEASNYVSTWLTYQSLWDISIESVTAVLKSDVKKWQDLLSSARSARLTLDNSDDSSTHSVGPISIAYSKVQNKINLKFDAWQKSLQTAFASLLHTEIKDCLSKFTTSKSNLEKISLEGSTSSIIEGVTYIQEMKQTRKLWATESQLLDSSEQLLKRQRFAFFSTWIHSSMSSSAFSDFETILNRRTKQMDDQIPALQQRVRSEDKQMGKRVSDLISKWEKEKPLSGSTPPQAASESLASFEVTFKKCIHDFDQLSSAKIALSLPPSEINNPLTNSYEELSDLSEVWAAVRPVHDQLEELNDTPWSMVIPRKIRGSLNAFLESLRALPSKIRQYDVFTHLNTTIKSYAANHGLLADLKTDALKPRHWKLILDRLSIRVSMAQLTLGHLFDAGILTKKDVSSEILSIAQGEMALEIFLNQVRDYWQQSQLELVLYQNRVRLIKSWDLLFSKLEEHMGSISQMKQSPYFKSVPEFKEEAALWEERLTKLEQIFDLWIGVQRRWVYLESIFFGSADIKAQLPSEYSRFKSVDTEFTQLMKKVAQKPNALEALQIENLLKQLERQDSLMTKIQKALGEYLANQREAFSRFYFVGDEDLLEIIGNSNEPAKVMAHLGKMFASVNNMRWLDPADTKKPNILTLTHMASKDGELVALVKEINVLEKVPAKVWLASIEAKMKETLAALLCEATSSQPPFSSTLESEKEKEAYIQWASSYPAQITILSSLIHWSMGINSVLSNEGGSLSSSHSTLDSKLQLMASTILSKLTPQTRKKFEQLITELVHQRDVTRELIQENVSSATDFKWLYHLRFQYNPENPDLLQKLNIRIANASFFYGFEYLGIGERLVQTPLTERCYLTLTQALHFRMGGNPFGPAGTGKTESVKALGAQLGRFVLVWCCDQSFDHSAMGRLFAGLCQVGAWGCFDEFNRLEERILSAVSQQILAIQKGLIMRAKSVELLGRTVSLHDSVGIFVTMNPDYAGRSNLPDNLKQLFRAVAMVIPDRKLITQVMLFSQGIVSAEVLSGKIVLLFQLCEEQLSKQSHYDFGLRALKTLLVSAGDLKRKAILGDGLNRRAEGDVDMALVEKSVLIQGACNNVVPKLVAEDLPLFSSLLKAVFPNSDVRGMEDAVLVGALKKICHSRNLVSGDFWTEKVIQLREVLSFRHGVMMVGPTGSGKSTAWRSLIDALELVDGTKGEAYVIDPKAINKEGLYGSLDPTTMEWTDGIFTATLRHIISNQRGESNKRHWIVFDGDVDPEWAENLNSVLDDNKLLTLPSGERLSLPDNVRVLLEVDSLEKATPATVSRCGMVWFSEETISPEMCLKNMIFALGGGRDDDDDDKMVAADEGEPETESASSAKVNPNPTQAAFVAVIRPYFISSNESPMVVDMLDAALKLQHVMTPTRGRLLTSLTGLLRKGIDAAINFDENHPEFPMVGDHMENFAKRWLLYSLLWAFSGSCSWDERKVFSTTLLQASGMSVPEEEEEGLPALRVRERDGEWEPWADSVPRVEIESHKVTSSDLVITTTDTVRHVDVLSGWLSTRKPLILCGPPGSGKTMTLTSTLQSIPEVILAPLNFSSGTTPELILKTFHQHCVYVRTPNGVVLEPSQSFGIGKWLVIFCDEINLPQPDTYGTQTVISFMRQLTEQGGFWRDDNTWVKLNRIQFVGACNPPTDAGRVWMSDRFMRHASLLLVDFPSRDSLMQIYTTFNGGTMKLFPNLKGEIIALTEAMVELYLANQKKFTVDVQPQYFYSPRELSRWTRAIYEAVKDLDALSRDELVRLWAHEALRLFHDRLVSPEEREWCQDMVDEVANNFFPGLNDNCLKRPILYSTWLSKQYSSVQQSELRVFMAARLKDFYEEELDVPLVVYDEVLEHVLRIDRVLKQPMGHCLLVGDSGSGKTVLSKFVSWMNGLNIFQIKAHSKYGIEDFNEDLRSVMKLVGVQGEKICFIFDESNALSSGFLEAMNALLASGEVPGLFEGDELTALMASCREIATKEGIVIGGDEELWERFTKAVQVNLHVVFTMNPSGDDFSNRSTTSPALFNRCVVDWFGTWSTRALGQVGAEFTSSVDLGDEMQWSRPTDTNFLRTVADVFNDVDKHCNNSDGDDGSITLRKALVASLVQVHNSTKTLCEANNKTALCRTYLSPRDFLDLITNFVKIVREKRGNLEEQQLHINIGLEKLRLTHEQVRVLEEGLGVKEKELREKEAEANSKLQQMIADQNIAENQKKEADKMTDEVNKQQEEISKRQEEAKRELDQAEPALINAQESVKSIRKAQLDEIRALARPPDNVRLTLEAVAIMMGERKLDWGTIRGMINKREFIPGILDFNLDLLGDRQIEVVKANYLALETFNVDSVTRSSKACGPLFNWVESQIRYSEIFHKVEPLRAEVEKLQKDADSIILKKEEAEKQVEQLEERIATFKVDYAELIRNVETIKGEMSGVKNKIVRANTLINSLMVESERWQASSGIFASQIASVVGDGLLSASFLTYGGFFDHRNRGILLNEWKGCLDGCGVVFRDGFESVIEYLSKGSERLAWEASGLPKDNLCLENAIILERFNRFPLIIDPSGQATEFLMQKYKREKIIKTSFLDGGFLKTLASAVRFGSVLLVQDVENVDPILNPILNKELMRTGGRTLVRLGSEDIDYSPKFVIILTTRDSAVRLTPDLCSRVTLVNFTITPASLQSQALSMLLRAERPEMEGKRGTLMKLRGEQNVRLRELEDRLLDKISSVEGSILDDDSVIKGMEEIKQEGKIVEQAIQEGEVVMKEVKDAIGIYEGFAGVISELYFCLEGLQDVNAFYQFSLQMFMSVLGMVLGTESKHKANFTARLGELKTLLFDEVLGRVGRGLFDEDKLAFGLRMGALKGGGTKGSFDVEAEGKCLESFVESGTSFLSKIFGSDDRWQGRGLNFLQEVVEKEVEAGSPVLLCSAPGYDVSGRVMHLAKVLEKNLDNVAMGSNEGFLIAEKLIGAAAKVGGWVMLKNIHLCPREWLVELEKKLFGMSYHAKFRLFLTCEMAEESAGNVLPLTLVRMSDVIVCEAPFGLKASLARFFGSIDSDRFGRPPFERGRLYMLVAWIYSIVQERLRYSPTGWSKKYEFSEADALNALDVVDAWVEKVGGGNKNHIAPETLPWKALRSLLSVSVFGGRIDNQYDQEVLECFIDNVFVPQAYDVDFKLVETLALPEGGKWEDMIEWIEALPATNSPTWLGLSGAAESVRLRARGARVLGKLMALGGSRVGGGEEGRPRSSSVAEKIGDTSKVIRGWLSSLAGAEKGLLGGEDKCGVWVHDKGENMNSLMRCIAREIKTGIECAKQVVGDIREVMDYCDGSVKLTNKIRILVDSISAGVTPQGWIDLYEGGGIVADIWINDFVKRIEQVRAFSRSGGKNLDTFEYWIGGLFNPGSFVTATRQFVARRGNHSVDELELLLNDTAKDGFMVSGIMSEGAKLQGGEIVTSDELIESVGSCCFTWRVKEGEEAGTEKGMIMLPVYLNNSSRKKIIVSVKVCSSGDRTMWLQRGLAFFFS